VDLQLTLAVLFSLVPDMLSQNSPPMSPLSNLHDIVSRGAGRGEAQS
jgi:hypothetical protein